MSLEVLHALQNETLTLQADIAFLKDELRNVKRATLNCHLVSAQKAEMWYDWVQSPLEAVRDTVLTQCSWSSSASPSLVEGSWSFPSHCPWSTVRDIMLWLGALVIPILAVWLSWRCLWSSARLLWRYVRVTRVVKSMDQMILEESLSRSLFSESSSVVAAASPVVTKARHVSRKKAARAVRRPRAGALFCALIGVVILMIYLIVSLCLMKNVPSVMVQLYSWLQWAAARMWGPTLQQQEEGVTVGGVAAGDRWNLIEATFSAVRWGVYEPLAASTQRVVAATPLYEWLPESTALRSFVSADVTMANHFLFQYLFALSTPVVFAIAVKFLHFATTELRKGWEEEVQRARRGMQQQQPQQQQPTRMALQEDRTQKAMLETKPSR